MLKYIKGDATEPQTEGRNCIAHVCNDVGKWGKGFVLALSKKWAKPEQEYYRHAPYRLGDMHYVTLSPELCVCNMIAQHDLYTRNNIPPIRYEALIKCLLALTLDAKEHRFTIHMPRIGCGLAGGDWTIVEKIIQGCLYVNEAEVYVYDLK